MTCNQKISRLAARWLYHS